MSELLDGSGAWSVRVPGSTSNLGSGFDVLGLAVTRYLEAHWTPGAGPLTVRYGGTLVVLTAHADRDLTARALTAALSRAGAPPPGGTLALRSGIPVGRGLGSSGAAVAAGMALAALALGRELDREGALVHAAELEGHPDNAAPALMGGLVGVTRRVGGEPLPFRLPLAADMAFAYAAPGSTVSTAEARRALPASVPHEQAVAGLGRAAALVHGLATADPDLLAAGFHDDLHVPYRLPLIPRAGDAWQAGLAAGAWAVTVSGSGSGLFAVTPPGRAAAVADAMGQAFAASGPGAIHFPLEADTAGVQTVPPRRVGTVAPVSGAEVSR